MFCDLDLLEQRETSRGNRKIGTAKEQFFRVHSGIEYDLSVNTTNKTAGNCAMQIITAMKALKVE